MPSTEDFTRMGRLAEGLAGHPYQPWLLARSRGLKAQAAEALAVFLDQAASWTEADRRVFVVWLDELKASMDDLRALSPHPLMVRLILPTLRRWRDDELSSATPHLLLARFHDWKLDETPPIEHFRAAFDRDPDLVAARRGVIHALFDRVEYSQHHLPGSYLGDREQDVALMDEAAALAGGLPDDEARDLSAHAAMLRERALGLRDDGGLPTYGFPA